MFHEFWKEVCPSIFDEFFRYGIGIVILFIYLFFWFRFMGQKFQVTEKL